MGRGGGARAPDRGSNPRAVRPPPASPAERFRTVDRYRVQREWQRYEGTAQRDLFLTLRQRFIARHRSRAAWTADIGSGPGRFTPELFVAPGRAVMVDLSREMLREARRRIGPAGALVDAVRGDGARAPIRRGSMGVVAALGNPLGFAGLDADRMLSELAGMVAPGGTLLLELVCGSGERSRYLSRLPPGAVGRLLMAPVNLVRSRADREGYEPLPAVTKAGSAFRRYSTSEVERWLVRRGFSVLESMAVAPAMGGDPERVLAVRPEPRAWSRLLELEELLGRSPARQLHASAVLVAARADGAATASPLAPSSRANQSG